MIWVWGVHVYICTHSLLEADQCKLNCLIVYHSFSRARFSWGTSDFQGSKAVRPFSTSITDTSAEWTVNEGLQRRILTHLVELVDVFSDEGSVDHFTLSGGDHYHLSDVRRAVTQTVVTLKEGKRRDEERRLGYFLLNFVWSFSNNLIKGCFNWCFHRCIIIYRDLWVEKCVFGLHTRRHTGSQWEHSPVCFLGGDCHSMRRPQSWLRRTSVLRCQWWWSGSTTRRCFCQSPSGPDSDLWSLWLLSEADGRESQTGSRAEVKTACVEVEQSDCPKTTK